MGVVGTLGAMQAQDYAGALWSVGLRMPGESKHTTEVAIEKAIAQRTIIRTWPMRGTLHLVSAEDIRWMLELLTPRVIAGTGERMNRLELNEGIFARCRKLFTKALEGDRQLTREAMMELLEKEKISTAGMRGYHIFWRLAQEGTICFAARTGKQHTFALLHEWAPKARKLDREVALAELAARYFTGHGPATLQDFMWWSGLKSADARAGMESATMHLTEAKVGKTVYWMSKDLPASANGSSRAYLLPGFDEYILGYNDRSAVLEPKHFKKIVPGSNGVFANTLVLDGRVVGTWKREVKKDKIVITATPFGSLKKAEKQLFERKVFWRGGGSEVGALIEIKAKTFGHRWTQICTDKDLARRMQVR
jgi:hypothetical protein